MEGHEVNIITIRKQDIGKSEESHRIVIGKSKIVRSQIDVGGESEKKSMGLFVKLWFTLRTFVK